MSSLRSLQRIAEAAVIPLRSTIELLAPCNLKCPHCYVTHSRRTRLTLAVLADLFDQMQAAGGLYLTLTGGEIGLRKDLFEIVAEARTRHFNVKLLSSGTMWTARHWDRIAELGVSCVRFSLYATQACVHDQVTLTPGSHAKTMASAMALLDRGVQVELACPVMKANAHEVGEVIALGEKLGVAVGMDPNITLTDTSGNLPKKTVATFEQLVAVYRDPRVKARLMTVDACEPTGDARPCGVGEVSTFIQSSGDVLPCSNWPQSAGNILEQSYLDIFRGSPVFKYCRSLRRRDLTTCSGCGDKAVCHPCAAMNLRETGSVGKPSSTVCNSAAASAVALFGETRQMHRRGRLPIVAVIVA